jgi:excisionase family DNA binding protein
MVIRRELNENATSEFDFPHVGDDSEKYSRMARRLYRTHEVWEMLNLSRDMLFAIIRSGDLRSIKVGRLRLIPAEAIDEYVARKLAEEDAHHSRA